MTTLLHPAKPWCCTGKPVVTPGPPGYLRITINTGQLRRHYLYGKRASNSRDLLHYHCNHPDAARICREDCLDDRKMADHYLCRPGIPLLDLFHHLIFRRLPDQVRYSREPLEKRIGDQAFEGRDTLRITVRKIPIFRKTEYNFLKKRLS